MRAKPLLKAILLGTSAFFVAYPVLAQPQDASQQSGDPIAEAARRSREAKLNSAKPRKVYTDDDVAHSKPEPPTTADAAATDQNAPPADGSAPTGTAGKKSATEKEKPLTPAEQEAKKESDWRKRFREQHEKIARAEKELDVLQRETEKAQVQYYPDPQKALEEQYSRKDINDRDAKIAAKQQEITQLKQGLADMEDSLRAAGGDPGWAR
jgi:hypothetical protein